MEGDMQADAWIEKLSHAQLSVLWTCLSIRSLVMDK